MSLNIFSRDSLRKHVEQLSQGKNTVLYDSDGNPSFMAIIPKMNIGDVIPEDAAPGLNAYRNDIHPAFEIYNGTDKVGETPEIFVSLYQNTLMNGSACSIPNHIPDYTTYANIQGAISRKGNNWHLMNIWEYALLQMYAYNNNIDVLGNSDLYGGYEDKDGATMALSNQCLIYMETDLSLQVGDVFEGEGEFDGIKILVKEIYSREEDITDGAFLNNDMSTPIYSKKYHLKIEFITGDIDPEDINVNLYTDVIPIYSETHLSSIGVDPEYPLYGHYILMNDIDLDYETAFVPIGSVATPFTGLFDGQGYKIIGLTISVDGDVDVGLFSSIGTSGIVKNLGIETVDISNGVTDIRLGPLAGSCFGAAINNCYVKDGVISGNASIGGLIGLAVNTVIKDCHTEGLEFTVSGGNIGGVLGYLSGSGSQIFNCYSLDNTINGDDTNIDVGGFIGEIVDVSLISDCYCSGIQITDCLDDAAGFAGSSTGNIISTRIFNCCVFDSSVSADDKVGGFIGESKGAVGSTISNCFSTTAVTGATNEGGFCGILTTGTISNCLWDTETSGQATSDGGTGKTTSEMQLAETYLESNWDFNNHWVIYQNLSQYPKLRINGYIPVSTSSEFNQIRRNPADSLEEFLGDYSTYIEISTEEQLRLIGSREYPDNRSYLLMNDITLVSAWDSIETFSGRFDGGSYTITINSVGSDYCGFIKYNSGTIMNTTINYNSVLIDSLGDEYFGGLVGKTVGGYIQYCNCTGGISIVQYSDCDYFGGLVGFQQDSVIYDCYTSNLNIAYANVEFTPEVFDATIRCLKIDSDGNIIIGGDFTTPGNRLVKLNKDTGNFTDIGAGILSGVVYDIQFEDDGNIIIAGSFSLASGGYLARVSKTAPYTKTDMSIAGSTIDGTVLTCAIDSNGDVIIGGAAGILIGNDGCLARVDKDTYAITPLAEGYVNHGYVNSIALRPNNNIVVAGYNCVDFTHHVGSICEVSSSGTLSLIFGNPSFDNIVIRTCVIDDGGDVYIGTQIKDGCSLFKLSGYDGTIIKSINSHKTSTVHDLKIVGDYLYGCGSEYEDERDYLLFRVRLVDFLVAPYSQERCGFAESSYISSMDVDSDENIIYAQYPYIGKRERIGISSLGGLVGYSLNSGISRCYTSGTVSDFSIKSNIGGLVGVLQNSDIYACYSRTEIENTKNIVSGYNMIMGGLIGQSNNTTLTGMIDCFSTGSVNNLENHLGNYVGGFIGSCNSKTIVRNCYAIGEINEKVTASGVGGFIGTGTNGVFSNCFWDTFSSGQPYYSGTAFLTNSEVLWGTSTHIINNTSTYTTSWDIDLASASPPKTWGYVDSESYPFLMWSANSDDTYKPCWYNVDGITIQSDDLPSNPVLALDPLVIPAYYYMLKLNDKYILMNDISITGFDHMFRWKPIGNSACNFTGIFNGNYYKITDLRIYEQSEKNIGLFGITGTTAVIKNLGFDTGDVDFNFCTESGCLIGRNNGVLENSFVKHASTKSIVEAKGNSIGGMVGYNTGTIKNCYSDISAVFGFISLEASEYRGGLVGYNTGTLENCYSSGTITNGGYMAGGLCGVNYGSINSCFSNCTLSGTRIVGGLIGTNSGATSEVKNSYSASNISLYNATTSTTNGIGGLIGVATRGIVENCYSVGLVDNSTDTSVADGGLIGNSASYVTVTSSYWNMETSEQSTSDGGTGLADLDAMNDEATFVDWDFNVIWDISEDVNYPQLKWSIGERTDVWINESLLEGEYWDYGGLVENPVFLWETDKRAKSPIDLNLFTTNPGYISIYNMIPMPYNTVAPLSWRHNGVLDGVQNLCSNHEVLDGMYCGDRNYIHITNGNYLDHSDDLYRTITDGAASYVQLTATVDALELNCNAADPSFTDLLKISNTSFHQGAYTALPLATGKYLLMLAGLHAIDFPASTLYTRHVAVYDENGDDIGVDETLTPTDLVTVFCSGQKDSGKIRLNKGLFYHIYNRLLSSDFNGLYAHLNTPWVFDFCNHPNNTFRCCYIPFKKII